MGKSSTIFLLLVVVANEVHSTENYRKVNDLVEKEAEQCINYKNLFHVITIEKFITKKET